MIVGNLKSTRRTDCVCDSGREWCCHSKTNAKSNYIRGGLGGWAGVSDDGAVGYCQTRWPKLGLSQWTTCANIIKTGQDPTPYMNTQTASSGGSSASSGVSDFFGALGKAIAGGVQGAAQANAAANTAAMVAQQQAAAQRTQMMVVIGVLGIGAFMLLKNRGD